MSLAESPESIPSAAPTSTFRSRALPITDRLSQLPWWALAAVLLGVLFFWLMFTDATYQLILKALTEGIKLTIFVTIVAYACSLVLGLIIALMRISKNFLIYQLSTFYVEIIRGIPTLVLLLYVAFVGFPAMIEGINGLGRWLSTVSLRFDPIYGQVAWLGNTGLQLVDAQRINGLDDTILRGSVVNWMRTLRLRDVNNTFRVIIALTIAYSAFIAEIFRAGIESIERGQMEAARALGMTHWQAMQHIILRQAFRRVLPPLGNDFIAMLKDSSLVSALGANDITQLGRQYAASTFRAFETYNVMAFLYLSMTLILSMFVKLLERFLSRELSHKE